MRVASIRQGDGTFLLRVPCEPPVHLAHVFFLLSELFKGLVSEDTHVLLKKNENAVAPDPITSGIYVLKQRDGDNFVPVFYSPPVCIPTLFPLKSKDRRGSSGSGASISDLVTAGADVEQLIPLLPPSETSRYARFFAQLCARDRGCIITGSNEISELAGLHLVPHSWKKERLVGLPEDVQDQLGLSELGVDDITNGFLLVPAYHKPFDNGHWSVVWTKAGSDAWVSWNDQSVGNPQEGSYMVVALHPNAPQEIVGKRLVWPTGSKLDGTPWSTLFPPPVFWHFHFTASVFKNIRAAGEGDEDAGPPDMEDFLLSEAFGRQSSVVVY